MFTLGSKTTFNILATMTDYIRLPWTNNWRMANISLDCYCTTPNASAENGFALADALQARGASVVGWDLEWGINIDKYYILDI